MAVFDIKTWLDSLKTEFKIPDDKIPVQEIDAYGMRQDKFSRRMQEYDTKEEALKQQQQQHERFEVYLRQLESRWGPREEWSFEQVNFANTNQPGSQGTPAAGLTEAQVDARISAAVKTALDEANKRFDTEIDRTRRGAAMLAEFIPDARDQWRDNYDKYGKFSEVKPKFEQFISPGDPEHGVQPGAGFGMPLQTAWGAFLQPYELKRQQETWEQQAKEREEAAYRRGRSEGPGSLEPGLDTGMSAGYAADLPVDPKNTGPSDAEKRSHFQASFDAAMRSQGVGAGRTSGPASTGNTGIPAAPAAPAAPGSTATTT